MNSELTGSHTVGMSTEGNHPIQGLMKTAMESIKGMIDVNTVVGEAVATPDGKTTIIPVSRVSLGFAAGGGEYGHRSETMPFGGGSGAGVTVHPVGFLVVNEERVRLLSVDHGDTLETILNTVPTVMEQVQGWLGHDTTGRESTAGWQRRSVSEGPEPGHTNLV